MGIERGDLVMVVRAPHACVMEIIGKVFRVTGMSLTGSRCPDCQWDVDEVSAFTDADFDHAVPCSWLIKINPPVVSESVTEREEIHEQA